MSVLQGCSLSRPVRVDARPCVRGKFIFAGDEKVHVRGVTYGAFRPDTDGNEYHDLEVVERDFVQMAANGFNAVRIPHTTPPRSLLDIAQRHGLRVMVGLSAEQYVGFLIDKNGAPDIAGTLRAKVRACAGHPALLCYAIGNEIPASVVRWIGRRRIERFLRQMYTAVKREDPQGLVTYVNYPTTEYLELPFLDLVCFNVYLESQERLKSYLARLQNLSGNRPLIMSEVGLDSLRNGEEAQASVLDWQVRVACVAGCAGVFIFSWTDEWFRGGADVSDWEFGLTDRQRVPKPALAAVREAFHAGPCPPNRFPPRISVIVCSFNGSRTIRDCCEGVQRLAYPNFEVLVVDDGSNDSTAAVVSDYGFRVIRTDNQGLSSARNTGLAAATGEIVAYIDDDAYPDPHWLTYLAAVFSSTNHAGVGGPNLTPTDDGPVAHCVGSSPGNPHHVLLTDEEAEQIPGCNMAFRKVALETIGGFDPQFRVAGDDVDVCLRLRQSGWTLGFSPAAVVWHHRRNSVRAYLKQQMGYGTAEGLLHRKWPKKQGMLGRMSWQGKIYGAGLSRALPFRRPLVYQGVWGHAPFQSVYEHAPSTLLSLPLMPEWYLVVFLLLGLSVLGILWKPMLLALPLLILSLGAMIIQAGISASQAPLPADPRSRLQRLTWTSLTALLHLLQPLARLCGRLRAIKGSPRGWFIGGFTFPWPRTCRLWRESWQAPEKRLESLEAALQARGVVVFRGGDYDGWDLHIHGGPLGSVRTCMAVEDHGGGRQLFRFHMWPRVGLPTVSLIGILVVLAVLAGLDQAWLASAMLGSAALALAMIVLANCGYAASCYGRALNMSGTTEEQWIR